MGERGKRDEGEGAELNKDRGYVEKQSGYR